jgi:hypothetical protein
MLDESKAKHPDFENTGLRCGAIEAIDNDTTGDIGKALDDLREHMLDYTVLWRVGAQ